ncbi:MAG: response regulator [Terracidiphilus sp.]|jgi:FixJ family two-component response regulator
MIEGVAEAYMGSMLKGSPLGDGKCLCIDQRFNSADLSEVTPVVFVVDPDGAMRESMERLIRCEGWHPETFSSAEEFLSYPVELAPGCMILDVCLPGMSGLELQKCATAKCHHIPTVFLSSREDIPTTVDAMKAGAIEFLLKPFQPEGLLSAIREGLERSRIVMARKKQKAAIQKCYTSLSLRERQVMALVSSGLLNKEVGCELGISEITVKAHRGQVMRKMQATSLADLVKMAGKLGLAKAREAAMHRNHVDRVAWAAGQTVGSYALAQ